MVRYFIPGLPLFAVVTRSAQAARQNDNTEVGKPVRHRG